MLEAILFDLDGTLADTAPDLGAAANRLRIEEGLSPLPLPQLRPYVSQGVRGLLGVAFGLTPEDAPYAKLADRFLTHYGARICQETVLFDGVPGLLAQIEAQTLAWGIVTNKRMRFTDPLVAELGLDRRTPCIVSGDTTAAAKPSPLPILHACALLAARPEHSIYVGDDKRDIEAGRAAGCRTIAVRYGYLGDGGPIESWGADLIVDHPTQIGEYLNSLGTPK